MLSFLLELCLAKFKMPSWRTICLLNDLTLLQVIMVEVLIVRQEERSVTSLHLQKVGTKPTLMVRPKATHEQWDEKG